jgi:hypothetical protein
MRRIAIARYRKLMGEAVEESYENIQSYAQAIKGCKASLNTSCARQGKSGSSED